MNTFPSGTILLRTPQFVFLSMPQVYIIPVLENVPNANHHVSIVPQVTQLLPVTIPNSNMNFDSCHTTEINNSCPIASIDDSSLFHMSSMDHSYLADNLSTDLISHSSDETPILYLSDSNSGIVDLNSDGDMSMSSVTDDDYDDRYVYDNNDGGDGDDRYITDDDDEESINGAYWF
ncbi:unnamed protein product [Adineta ricciae]|uniref:Uncharacterized protein n=1 Tax=Adineta ricciae TaxID=249248 RepID=A0A814LUH8_ADIRI|nr:unnamed protein product [Adineta ricciae]CAF1503840.1 unnamed protein product [Adineta ricciae]